MASIHRGAIAGLQADLSVGAGGDRPRPSAGRRDRRERRAGCDDGRRPPICLRARRPEGSRGGLGGGRVSRRPAHVDGLDAHRAVDDVSVRRRGRRCRACTETPPTGGRVAPALGRNDRRDRGCLLLRSRRRVPVAGPRRGHLPLAQPAAGQLMYNGVIWTVFGSADHFLGRCASTLGRVDDAERHFAAALAIEQRLGAPHLQARTHLRLAELRPRPGRSDTNQSSRRLPRSLRRAPLHLPSLVR